MVGMVSKLGSRKDRVPGCNHFLQGIAFSDAEPRRSFHLGKRNALISFEFFGRDNQQVSLCASPVHARLAERHGQRHVCMTGHLSRVQSDGAERIHCSALVVRSFVPLPLWTD